MDSETPQNLVDSALIKSIVRAREPFTNKGDYGSACIISGSYGMMGAAVMAAKACMRSGAGKLTCFIPGEGYSILQTSVPEAMVKVCGKKFIKKIQTVDGFSAIGIGPGIGMHNSHADLLEKLFSQYKKPVVLDADALNTMAANKQLLKKIPRGSILTPHPKEFERLFGKDKEPSVLAPEMAAKYQVLIVLKGHHTMIASPGEKSYFNTTGNAGMATAGSGDVLTGIITGLLAQGYSSLDCCLAGVYLHGLAGDIAADAQSQHAMIAGDIIDNLGHAFKKVTGI